MLRRLELEWIIPREVGDRFHHVRIKGNQAAHDPLYGTPGDALTDLKKARFLGIWFHRFDNGPEKIAGFVVPPDPAGETERLRAEVAQLRKQLADTGAETERTQAEAEEQQRSRLSAEEHARKEQEDKVVWEQLAAQAEAAQAALAAKLAQLQAEATAP